MSCVVFHRVTSVVAGTAIIVGCCAMVGCSAMTKSAAKTIANDTSEVEQISAAIDYPSAEVYPAAMEAGPPITATTIRNIDSYSYQDMGLRQLVRIAMDQSVVLRELGSTVLRSPDAVKTRYAQQIQDTDPRFSREAALSAFDTQLNASAIFNNTDRIFNNSFFAGGATGFKQDLHDYEAELSKVTASGSLVALRSVFSHDNNNAPANTFRSAWNAYLEGEVRQPLMQGGGVEFNRIAGPNSAPGVYNGLLIARTNADITETEFEIGVRDFISNVENAYWDLFFAYRDVEARRKAVLQAQDAWDRRKALESEADPAELALAREQYYRFKADLDEAVTGRLVQGTQSRNGSNGGTLRGTGGLLVAERKLRLLVGLPTSDGTLIRPSDEPPEGEIDFDWGSARNEAFEQRAELRQQQTRVRQRELELLAAKNFLIPRLDAFGRYRLRGFGDDLAGAGSNTGTAPATALGKLATGELQGWTAGVEFSVPLGYRQANAAVANAEIRLAREKSIHQEQQREIAHDLSNAIGDVARAMQASRNNLNRYLAASDALEVLLENDEKVGRVEVDRILDAQRRAVEAEIRYFRSRAEYAVAIKNVHFEKGSLLEFNDMRLAESPTGELPSDGSFSVIPPTDSAALPMDDEPFDVPSGAGFGDEVPQESGPRDYEAPGIPETPRAMSEPVRPVTPGQTPFRSVSQRTEVPIKATDRTRSVEQPRSVTSAVGSSSRRSDRAAIDIRRRMPSLSRGMKRMTNPLDALSEGLIRSLRDR